MSIYNHQYAPDDEITSDNLNQLSADANNSTDNIHPQYRGNILYNEFLGYEFELYQNTVSPGGYVHEHINGVYSGQNFISVGEPVGLYDYYRFIPIRKVLGLNHLIVSGNIAADDSLVVHPGVDTAMQLLFGIGTVGEISILNQPSTGYSLHFVPFSVTIDTSTWTVNNAVYIKFHFVGSGGGSVQVRDLVLNQTA